MEMKGTQGRSFADGSVGARVRMMVMGLCLPVRGSEWMAWKYHDHCCGCAKSQQKNMCCLNLTVIEKSE